MPLNRGLRSPGPVPSPIWTGMVACIERRKRSEKKKKKGNKRNGKREQKSEGSGGGKEALRLLKNIK